MRPEVLDIARREILADLVVRLDASGVAGEERERIAAETTALLDRVLFALDEFNEEADRRTAAVVAEFTLCRLWPVMLAPRVAAANPSAVHGSI